MYMTRVQNKLTLAIRVLPNARRSGVEGLWNGSHLKIALSAPPVDGKANEALINFLSDFFDLRKSAITLLTGQTGRIKTISLLFSTSELAESAGQKLEQICGR
ncbi:MAG: DUF167 domain-containing protein [Alphaproteobacteria bacterium]|nr:DUF167 domain-containing protein [Alphaproteobacteria bacterium]